MSITTDDIKKLASLSRINISNEETVLFAKEIDGILGYVEQIKEVSSANASSAMSSGANLSANVGPKTKPPHRNAMRDDIDDRNINSDPSILVKSAPESQDGYIKVKKILG